MYIHFGFYNIYKLTYLGILCSSLDLKQQILSLYNKIYWKITFWMDAININYLLVMNLQKSERRMSADVGIYIEPNCVWLVV